VCGLERVEPLRGIQVDALINDLVVRVAQKHKVLERVPGLLTLRRIMPRAPAATPKDVADLSDNDP
jgi:hypothetical protein